VAVVLRRMVSSVGHQCSIVKFAEPLYEMHDLCRAVLRRYGCDPFPGVDGRLLQLLGTEWGRNSRGQDLWVNLFRKRAESLPESHIIISDDARFPNELEGFDPAWRVVRIRLVAPEDVRKARAAKWRDDTEHESETALDGYRNFDLVCDTSQVSAVLVARAICGLINVSVTRDE
jgi:hypothetical protein